MVVPVVVDLGLVILTVVVLAMTAGTVPVVVVVLTALAVPVPLVAQVGPIVSTVRTAPVVSIG